MRRIEQLSIDLQTWSNTRKKRVMQAQQEAGQKICEDIKKGAPVDTGAYRDSIKVSKTYINHGQIVTRIYSNMTLGSANKSNTPTLPQWENVAFAKIIESGTVPHFIYPRDPEGLLRWEDEDGVHYAKYVHHPGTAPNPHWTTAILRNRPYYRRKIRKALGK